MKPIDQMDSDALNREIARLRGEITEKQTYIFDEHGRRPANIVPTWPNYLEWANAGKLLEEMQAVRVETEEGFHGWKVSWPTGRFADDGMETPIWNSICVAKGELTKAIRHAYYEWKRGKDADTE